ncbi:hypothetical protein Pla123a_30210 [Posidoniimonas polymericola]|uniref:Phage-related minor tail protein n=1 Tax=Posidoniimonas polymericola TaxID=2528002 RepID=A0A5C5YKW2_9BACT|nr:hypothetical protein [Posidoniimonas polymericola]TWT75512.1 hypothetical protein Pla123a_30210 [Posidoniimonas polymericola]
MAVVPINLKADVKAGQALNRVLGMTDEQLENIVSSGKGAAGAVERLARQADPMRRFEAQIAKVELAQRKQGLSTENARVLTEKYTRSLDYLGRTADRTLGTQLISKVGMLAAGTLSFGSAIALVRNELEALRQQADRIGQTHINAAGAREKLLQNTAGLSSAQREKFVARAEKLAASTGQPQNVIDSALADAYSGSGGNTEAAFRNVRIAAEYNPNTPSAIGPTAGALSDVSKSTGDLNAARNLGFLNKVGLASRVTDAGKQFKAIPQALGGLVTAEATAQESGALFAALSNAIPDTEGNVTATASINFGAKLEEFADKAIKSGKLTPDVDTFGERLLAVQGDAALGRAFVGMMGGEAKAKGALEQLVMDPNSDIAKAYAATKAGFGTAADQEAHGKRTLGIIAGDKYGNTATANRVVASLNERFELGSDGYLTEEAKQKLDQALLFSGRAASGDADFFRGTAWGNSLRRYAKTGSQVSIPEARAVIESEIASLERWQSYHGPGGSELQAGPEQIKDVNNALEKLERTADIFERIGEQAERMSLPNAGQRRE